MSGPIHFSITFKISVFFEISKNTFVEETEELKQNAAGAGLTAVSYTHLTLPTKA